MSKEPIGSVGEEAAKLFAVLQQAAAGTSGTTQAPVDDEAHQHKLGPDCVWCPVCQLINKVRNTSPETIDQLSSAAAHVIGSVRSLLEEAAEAARQSQADAASRTAQEEPVRSRVDRIDVSEDPEPWD
ncbi:MAG TPA: hypothetical protein VFI00_15675 [Kribbella sp.]|nr:hypothetical protein [Kribbella sp.]